MLQSSFPTMKKRELSIGKMLLNLYTSKVRKNSIMEAGIYLNRVVTQNSDFLESLYSMRFKVRMLL